MARDWKRWFEGYAADWQAGEVEAVAARYAPLFMVVKPGKSSAYANDERFTAWLDRVRGFHLEAGLERVEVVTFRETTLGDHHALVSVTWAVRFERTAALRIQFDISYVLSLGEQPAIVSAVSHEDQRQTMQRYALL
jgi:hypothetical protein